MISCLQSGACVQSFASLEPTSAVSESVSNREIHKHEFYNIVHAVV